MSKLGAWECVFCVYACPQLKSALAVGNFFTASLVVTARLAP